ncbi:MAG TPA: radical SAM protein [Terracidiphilus sp.]|nr:radical SAM protein [Terracidiphilus sp.]
MRVVLINPPRTNFDCEELAPPLGLIRLAQVALRCGWQATIEDFNLLWHLDPALRASFYDTALERLLDIDASIYGFTSMAVDSHIALELSRRLKRVRPACQVVLGGVHFSAIADRVAVLYPWVDVVLSGEAEQSFAEMLKPGTRVGSNDLQLSPAVLDQLHLPGYFYVNPRRMLNFETGRGCIFKCAFCYSPGHYSAVRNFPIPQVLEQMSHLSEFGIKHVWFVEDNFLNDRVRAKELCRQLMHLESGITWSCYATFPQMNEDVIEMMGQAGCTEVFCGVDAVGTVAERAFQKAFLRGETPITTKARQLTEAGIRPTFAFLVAPFSHEAGPGFDETVLAALEARVAGAFTLLNPLSLYAGTVAYRRSDFRFEPDRLQAQIMMDLPDVAESNPFAESHPQLFPFHSRYVEEGEWQSFLLQTRCISTLLHCYPKTLALLRESRGTHPREVAHITLQNFDDWAEVPKAEVRDVERDVGFAVLEQLCEGASEKRTLNSEYDSAEGRQPSVAGPSMM